MIIILTAYVMKKRDGQRKTINILQGKRETGKYYYVYNEPSDNILEKVSGVINNVSTTEKNMKQKVEKANELIDKLSELEGSPLYDIRLKELDELVESLKRSERVANDQRHGKSGIFTK